MDCRGLNGSVYFRRRRWNVCSFSYWLKLYPFWLLCRRSAQLSLRGNKSLTALRRCSPRTCTGVRLCLAIRIYHYLFKPTSKCRRGIGYQQSVRNLSKGGLLMCRRRLTKQGAPDAHYPDTFGQALVDSIPAICDGVVDISSRVCGTP